jgi:hypothetical protein
MTHKPKYHHSLKRAMKVAALIRMSREQAEDSTLRAFNNCREQGLTLEVGGIDDCLWFTFTEGRNHDRMCVDEGTGYAPPSGITEESYQNRKTFATEQEAADYITERLAA